MKSNYSIKFQKMEVPEFKQSLSYNQNYYQAGVDGKWFDKLIYLYENCSQHSKIINNLKRRIMKGMESDTVLDKAVLDYLITGCYSIAVRWNINHTKIIDIKHLDSSKVKIGLVNPETDLPSLYYYSNDWLKYNNREIVPLYPFNENPDTDDNQILYVKRYNPSGQDWSIYPKPYYYSCIKSIYTKIQIDNYYANLTKNNFVANTILSVPSFNDDEKQLEFEKEINKNFTSSENAGSMMIVYTDNSDNKPEIQKFNSDSDDEKYSRLNEDTVNEIFVGHDVPPLLAGIMVTGKLGSTSEIPEYEKIYDEFTVQPIKQEIMNEYNKVKKYMI